MSHSNKEWHELTEDTGHHHGVNPADYISVFGEPLQNYLDTYGSISYPWATPNENDFKHQGYVWLYSEAKNGCEQFNIDGNPNCVTHVLVQLHSIGNAHAALTRFHSQYAFIRISSPDGKQSGVVATGGWADYGLLHSPYKGEIVELESDPPGFAKDRNKFQPPYRANPKEFHPRRNVSQFWNSLGPAQNLINSGFFPEEPNHILGLAWQSPDAWQVLDYQNPSIPSLAFTPSDSGYPEINHSRFHVFSVRVDNLPEAPYYGWTNRHGHIVPNCDNSDADCVPLVVTSGVPSGVAWLNRQVNQGNPSLYSPPQEFDVFDEDGNSKGWIKFPVIEMPKD